MKLTTTDVNEVNIGPKHECYDPGTQPGHTQALVYVEGQLVAQFFGPYAKLFAHQFIEGMKP